ncbi:MAG: hypothetical protein AB1458_11660 [Bacteroidota bacterium]
MRHLLFLALILFASNTFACDCSPAGTISKEQTGEYHIIFTGKVDSVHKSTVLFSIHELYKGKSGKNAWLSFDDSSDCRMSFAKGEEWIIYARYTRFGEPGVEFCSRSRKKPAEGEQDLYVVSNRSTFAEEADYLEKNLGLQAFGKEREQDPFPERELLKPKGYTILWLFLGSLPILVLFYILLKKFL